MGKSQSRNKSNRSSLILCWTLAITQTVLCFTFNINFSSPSRSPNPLLLIMAAPSPSSGFKSTGPPPTRTNAVCLKAMRWYQFSLCLAALSCYPSPLCLLGLLLCLSLTLSAPVFLPAALLLFIHPAQPCQSDSAGAKGSGGAPSQGSSVGSHRFLPLASPGRDGPCLDVPGAVTVLCLDPGPKSSPRCAHSLLIYTASLLFGTLPEVRTHTWPLHLCLPEAFLHTVKF